uniref:Uncharacterized protein n=1 Tax=Dunaliella tertiolecta TaxID=3047 RepID=A0A7S3QWT0_DUNTE
MHTCMHSCTPLCIRVTCRGQSVTGKQFAHSPTVDTHSALHRSCGPGQSTSGEHDSLTSWTVVLRLGACQKVVPSQGRTCAVVLGANHLHCCGLTPARFSACGVHLIALPIMHCWFTLQTEDDKRRLKGSGLLVADKGVDVMQQLDESAFYLAASQEAAPGSSPPLQIVDGAMIQEGSYVGLAKIVFVARPPLRDMGMGQQARSSSEDSLIQI